MDTEKTIKTPLWGGGFAENMHPSLYAISESMVQDLPLATADLHASALYAEALGRCQVLDDAAAKTLRDTLLEMRDAFIAGDWHPENAEDVHTAIEAEVTARLGDLGARLHTGRSRNDQVSCAFRLALAERLQTLTDAVAHLQSTLVMRAESDIETLMPAYTHLQRAQPVRLAHMILAWFWPLQRDVERLYQVIDRMLTSPLGAGAVSGHPFGLDRQWLCDALAFRRISQNSIDTVGDRDFAVEAAFAVSMVALHLSRMAEDLVLWSSTEFQYVHWPDSLATGSSLMPNKKNPDLAELVRGRSAQAVGDVVALLTLIKGLPSSYQRDLQEDKPPVWRITTATFQSVQAMQSAMALITFDKTRLAAALTDDLLATEAADVLVNRGVPFRHAHSLVAKLVAAARARNVGIVALADATDFTLPEPLTADDLRQLSMVQAVERRTASGGTAKSAVREQISLAQGALKHQVLPRFKPPWARKGKPPE